MVTDFPILSCQRGEGDRAEKRAGLNERLPKDLPIVD